MRYRMSVIYGHPVIAATRALRFADHVTKRNGGSGDENAILVPDLALADCACVLRIQNGGHKALNRCEGSLWKSKEMMFKSNNIWIFWL